MPKHGAAYVAQGLAACEAAYRERAVNNLRRKARELGYELTPAEGAEGQPA
jgi:hypothetical protein